VVKVYRLTLTEHPTEQQIRRLEEGVRLPDGGLSAPAQARLRGRRGDHVILDLAVHEGRYHLVRDMCESLGMRLLHLHRVAYGPLRLGELKVGRWRPLTAEELALLRRGAKRPRDVPPRGERALNAAPRAPRRRFAPRAPGRRPALRGPGRRSRPRGPGRRSAPRGRPAARAHRPRS
jgi:23S rRNA pseudouridine2605 synthase